MIYKPTCLQTEEFSCTSTIHPGIFLKGVLFKQYSLDVLKTNILVLSIYSRFPWGNYQTDSSKP